MNARTLRSPALLAGGILLALAAAPLLAQGAPFATIQSDGVPPELEFGASVAIGRDQILVGAPGGGFRPGPDGRVYVLDATGASSYFTDGDAHFGAELALSGDLLAVRGSEIALYRREAGGWVFEAVVGGANPSSMSLDGGRLAIGRVSAGIGGRVDVYERSVGPTPTWTLAATLTASDAAPGARFGIAVRLSRDALVAGAVGPFGAAEGSAYVFVRDASGAWSERQRLQPSGLSSTASFGASLALEGELLVVGAQLERFRGAVFVYRRGSDGSFQLEARLDPRFGEVYGYFGRDLRLGRDELIVAAFGEDVGHGTDAGRVYRYARPSAPGGAWELAGTLSAPDFLVATSFGKSLACGEGLLAVGVSGGFLDPGQGNAVHLFDL